MKDIGNKVLKFISKVSMKAAETSPETMSVFYFYEPKMPESLKKKNK